MRVGFLDFTDLFDAFGNDLRLDGILDRLVAEKKRGKPQVTRFKGLGEMNPPQLRETTMDPNTRRLVQLSLDDFQATHEVMDMLLAKKRAGDRKRLSVHRSGRHIYVQLIDEIEEDLPYEFAEES